MQLSEISGGGPSRLECRVRMILCEQSRVRHARARPGPTETRDPLPPYSHISQLASVPQFTTLYTISHGGGGLKFAHSRGSAITFDERGHVHASGFVLSRALNVIEKSETAAHQ